MDGAAHDRAIPTKAQREEDVVGAVQAALNGSSGVGTGLTATGCADAPGGLLSHAAALLRGPDGSLAMTSAWASRLAAPLNDAARQ